jgi:nucleoside-diphosphate-sugar epimerase
MILFTGGGKIADQFKDQYPAKIISARKLSDEVLAQELGAADIVYNNAALIYGNQLDEFIAANFLLTRRIVRICEEVNPSVRFINFSTMSLLLDDQNYLPVEQMNDYAFSKYIAENYCFRSGLANLSSVRFSTIFYGDAKRDGISELAADCQMNNEITLINNGEAKRDIIPLRILVQYLYKVGVAESLQKTYNLVSGTAISFREIADILKEINPALRILNKEIDTHDVLSDFSRQDIEALGEIAFSLREEITNHSMAIQ